MNKITLRNKNKYYNTYYINSIYLLHIIINENNIKQRIKIPNEKIHGWKTDLKKLLRMQHRKTEMKIPEMEAHRIKWKKKTKPTKNPK